MHMYIAQSLIALSPKSLSFLGKDVQLILYFITGNYPGGKLQGYI